MSSYNENISRLKNTANFNTSLANRYENENASAVASNAINNANQIADGLQQFSGKLKEWNEKRKEKAQEEGTLLAQQARSENSQKLAALSQELLTVKEQDTRYHEIKAEMLKLSGPDVYPEADRLAKLSPWQQVGYAREKLRMFNETFDDKLAYMMQNSDQAISIQGMTFTPRELRENNITGLPFKEAAVQAMTEQLKREAGIYKFSPELLALAKTNDAIQKAKDGQMEKFRERYNIDASMQTRGQALLEWQGSERTGQDLHRLLIQNAATIDKNNQVLGNTGGWDQVMTQLTKEGVALADPTYADTIGNLPLPETLRQQLGAKPGTTYKQQWPGRFTKLKSDIKSGYVAATDAELKFQKADGKKLEAEFIELARQGDLTSAEVNEWIRKFGKAGLPIPAGITNYETVSDRDQREDEDMIEALMASQNGYITNAQLDQFHPKAALEHREKATKLEKAALKDFDAEKKIKAHLDTAFTNMGIKGNEKSPAYVEAMSNAKIDYANKYNRYVGMGYDPAMASHLALHAKQGEIKDEDGNPISDSQGVLTEIRENGESSKYVITGQSIENELKPGQIRVARIASGKREIIEDPNIIFKGTIGDAYGKKQLTSVMENIEKYGVRKGVNMDKSAMQYYKGLARGRDGNWMGLLDAQLKAVGHPGLWEKGRPEVIDLFEGKDVDGNDIIRPEGQDIRKSIARAGNYPSKSTYLYQRNQMKDGSNYWNPTSTWDNPENLPAWYTVGGAL